MYIYIYIYKYHNRSVNIILLIYWTILAIYRAALEKIKYNYYITFYQYRVFIPMQEEKGTKLDFLPKAIEVLMEYLQ